MSEKHVEALLVARKGIEVFGHNFICAALPGNKEGEEIRTYIVKALEGRGTLGIWLCFLGYNTAGDRRKLRETRLAWIDHMIELWRNEP